MRKIILCLSIILTFLFLVGCEIKKEVPEVCEEAIPNTIIYNKLNTGEPSAFSSYYNPLLDGYTYYETQNHNLIKKIGYTYLYFQCREAETGENINYLYCYDIPFSKRRRITNEQGILTSDIDTFYLADLIINNTKNGSISKDVFEVVQKKCWQIRIKEYK
jgi:hypothetical protein